MPVFLSRRESYPLTSTKLPRFPGILTNWVYLKSVMVPFKFYSIIIKKTSLPQQSMNGQVWHKTNFNFYFVREFFDFNINVNKVCFHRFAIYARYALFLFGFVQIYTNVFCKFSVY